MSESRGMRNTILKKCSGHTLLKFSYKMKTTNQGSEMEFVLNVKTSIKITLVRDLTLFYYFSFNLKFLKNLIKMCHIWFIFPRNSFSRYLFENIGSSYHSFDNDISNLYHCFGMIFEF